MTNNKVDVHPIIRQIIDRDCHVSMANRSVITHVISKLKDGYRSFRKMPKADRRSFMQQCICQHQQNWQLYVDVMRGQPVSSPVVRAIEEIPNGTLTGNEICSLMRKHRMPIKTLSFLMGITQRRIREVRRVGLRDPLAVRDWYEAITAVDPGPIPQRYRISRQIGEVACCHCGCPLDNGDLAYEYVGEVFCSITCCRRSRGL